MKNVLLLKAGDAHRDLVLRAGDYERWFHQSLLPLGVRLQVVVVNRGAVLPAHGGKWDAVMMTGSPLSMTRPAAWMLRAGEWMLEEAERKVPVLGVCFGHQLLGHLLGARVIRNPAGRETGSVRVQLTEAGRRDSLYAGVSPTPFFNATHEDVLDRLPPGATLLASNANTAVQSMAIGRFLRTVQFHPELNASGMRALISTRSRQLEKEGARIPALLAAVAPDVSGPRVFRNFLQKL